VGTVAAVTAVIGGAGAASAALWYYSRRYSYCVSKVTRVR
jgi:hypothetical protein